MTSTRRRGQGDYAGKINSMQKYVASTTLREADWAGTDIISDGLAGRVAGLKQEPGGDILMHGFGPVARTLLTAGLLDELHLWVHPELAGVGEPGDMLFGEGTSSRLSLLGSRPGDLHRPRRPALPAGPPWDDPGSSARQRPDSDLRAKPITVTRGM